MSTIADVTVGCTQCTKHALSNNNVCMSHNQIIPQLNITILDCLTYIGFRG